MTTTEKVKRVCINLLKVSVVLGFLYLFICSLDFLSSAFRLIAGKTTSKFHYIYHLVIYKLFTENLTPPSRHQTKRFFRDSNVDMCSSLGARRLSVYRKFSLSHSHKQTTFPRASHSYYRVGLGGRCSGGGGGGDGKDQGR